MPYPSTTLYPGTTLYPDNYRVFSAVPSLEEELAKYAVTLERWTRFRWEAYFSKSPSEGWMRLRIDDRAEPNGGLFSAQYDSGKVAHQTLAYANGAQETGSPAVKYTDEQAIPSHFRLGQYRNKVINPGEKTVTRAANVQTYEGGGGELVEVA